MRRLALVVALLAAACKPAVDFDTGRPYACDDDSQCGSLWRCGLSHVCHAVGAVGPYACRYGDATVNDCEGDWRCGVLGFCLDPADAGQNACLTDDDCYAGHRCNVEKVCVDPSAELLGAANTPPTAVTVLAPVVAPQGVDGELVAYGIDPKTGDSIADAQRDHTLVCAVGGQVTAVTATSLTALPRALDAGTYAQIRALAATGRTAWVLTDTGLSMVGLSGSPVPISVSGVDPSWALHNAGLTGWDLVSYVADGGNSLRLISSSGVADVVRQGPAGNSVGLDYLGFGACLFAGRQGGIWAASTAPDGGLHGVLPDAGWGQLDLPDLGPACGLPFMGMAPQLRVRGAQPNLLAVAIEKRGPPDDSVHDGGFTAKPSTVVLYDVSALLHDTPGAPDAGALACAPTPSPAVACGDPRVSRVVGPCAPCVLTDEQLLDFFPLTLDTRYALQTQCIGPNSGLRVYEVTESIDGVCTTTRIFTSEPKYHVPNTPLLGGTNPFGFGKAGPHGELWVGDGIVDADPLFLDRPAQGLFHPDTMTDAGHPVRMFADDVVAEVNRAGLVRVNGPRNSIATVSEVVGAPEQVLFADGRIAKVHHETGGIVNVTVTTVDAPEATFVPPFSAKIYHRADGVFQYVVRSFDSIYAGKAMSNGNFEQLKLQLLPSPGAPVQSIVVFSANDADAGLSEGWALTRTGLFALKQDLLEQWSSVPVPTAVGTRVKVFAETRKARLGYDDGTVYALPSRVPIAAAVPGMLVNDYINACAETWALTNLGLMRLVPLDGGTGQSVNQPLDAGDAFSNDAIAQGHIIAFEQQVWLFNSFGGALTFVPEGGCPVNPAL